MEDRQQRILIVLNDIKPRVYPQLYNTLRQLQDVEVHLLHVVPTMPAIYFQIPSMAASDQVAYNTMRRELCELGSLLQIPSNRQWLCQGRLTTQAKKLAKSIKADYIVLDLDKLQIENDISNLLSKKRVQTQNKWPHFFKKLTKLHINYH